MTILVQRLIFALALLAATPAYAADALPSLSAEDRLAIDLAARRGAQMYAYDQAAWHGTDDMIAKLPDFGQKIGGYVVDGSSERPEIIFFDRDTANPHALYVGQMENLRIVSSKVYGAEAPMLSPARRALVQALAIARKAMDDAGMKPCGDQPFNTITLPPESAGAATRVYFLTPQKDWESIPFGSHYVVEISSNGVAAEPRGFTNGCINLPTSVPDGRAQKVAFITHLLDPVPTEIHVFSSYAGHMPVIVGIISPHQRYFSVTGKEIVPVDMPKRK